MGPYSHVGLCRSAEVKVAIVEVELAREFERPRNVARQFGLVTLVQAAAYIQAHVVMLESKLRVGKQKKS